MQNRIEKTQNETGVLKMETAEDSTKIIKPDKYEQIGDKAREILSQFGRQEIKKETPVVTILLRLEHQIDLADAFIKDREARKVEKTGPTFEEIKREVRKEIKKKMDAVRLEEQAEREKEEIKKKQLKSMPRYVCKDKKPEMRTFEKKEVQKKVIAKPQLT